MQDLTTGSLTRHLLKTTGFMLVSMIFQTLYVLIDLYWVGRLGTDAVAARIRDLAQRHGVPLVENPPLARLLHRTVDLGQPVPPAQYQAVAEIIGYVMRLRDRAASRPGGP